MINCTLNKSIRIRKIVKKIMEKYFQECYLDIINNDAYLIDKKGIVIKHLNWKKVSRKEAIENGDFTFIHETNSFYVSK